LIYTVTLNPAIDKVLFIDRFQKSRTNRVNRVIETLGGKGTHVSINLKLLGVDSIALGIGFGETGRKITTMLRDFGVDEQFLHYDTPGWESRTNVELVEEVDRSCTMITERGPMLGTAITDALITQIAGLIRPGDSLVLTGDASNVEDTAIYARLSEQARQAGVKVILDASGPYLAQGIQSTPYLIKPNFEEMCFIMGKEFTREEEVVAALHSLGRSGIEIIAMTWSGKGALVKFGEHIYRVNPLAVDVVNEAGCGDAFLAALLAGIEKGDDPQQTLLTAAAVAGAAAESEITVGFDLPRVQALRKLAVVTAIH
jgi:1-phosphofructokinase family hexose kinase